MSGGSVCKHGHLERVCEVCELQARVAELEGENESLTRALEKAEPHFEEALEILHDSIEDEDFQACFDKENFMVGPALLGNLNRIFDAVTKARAAAMLKARAKGSKDG